MASGGCSVPPSAASEITTSLAKDLPTHASAPTPILHTPLNLMNLKKRKVRYEVEGSKANEGRLIDTIRHQLEVHRPGCDALSLLFNDTDFDASEWAAFAAAVVESPLCPKITKMKFARCFPQSDDFLGLIQPTLSTEEVTISLNDVNLDSQAFDVLVNCIRAVGSPLGKIKLKECNITSPSCTKLIGELRSFSSLRFLSLENNNIGKKGAASISTYLATLPELRVLNLNSNKIDDHAGVALFSALKQNTNLTTLHIADNRLGVNAFIALSGLLAVNQSLVSIDVSDSSIKPEVAWNCLRRSLQSNERLLDLNLFERESNAEAFQCVVTAMMRRNLLFRCAREWPSSRLMLMSIEEDKLIATMDFIEEEATAFAPSSLFQLLPPEVREDIQRWLIRAWAPSPDSDVEFGFHRSN